LFSEQVVQKSKEAKQWLPQVATRTHLKKANLHRTLTAEEERRLSKLKAIAAKLKRGENVQSGL
jgi:hypothetical protein